MRSKHSFKSTYSREVQVLRIPADGTQLEILTVNTVTDDKTECKTIDARTTVLEDRLGHTPDLGYFHERRKIDLEYLSLFDRDPCSPGSATSEPFKPNDLYYIYKCVTETPAKLPRNKYLKRFKEARAYGDAFVFKVLIVDDFDGKDKADFASMDGFLRSLKRRGRAAKILKAMARW